MGPNLFRMSFVRSHKFEFNPTIAFVRGDCICSVCEIYSDRFLIFLITSPLVNLQAALVLHLPLLLLHHGGGRVRSGLNQGSYSGHEVVHLQDPLLIHM